MARKFGLSWSWKRASGLSGLKNKISRKIGIPLTKGGRQRKIGRLLGTFGLGLLFASRGKRQTKNVLPTGSSSQQTCGHCGHTWRPRSGKQYSPKCPNCGVRFTEIEVKRSNQPGCLGLIGCLTILLASPVVCCGLLGLFTPSTGLDPTSPIVRPPNVDAVVSTRETTAGATIDNTELNQQSEAVVLPLECLGYRCLFG